MPPGTPRSRSLTRFTMRVALPHLGQSVLLVVSMIFLRSAVFAILAPTAMGVLLMSRIFAQRDPRACAADGGGWNMSEIDPALNQPTDSTNGDPLGKTLKL